MNTKNTETDEGEIEITDFTHWYTLQVYSAREKVVKRTLLAKIENENLSGIKNILVPSQEIISISPKGKKTLLDKAIYPGYVFMQLDLSDELLNHINNTNFVSRFVGAKGEPVEMSENEIKKILNLDKEKEAPKYRFTFSIGDLVRVKYGAFTNYKGEVKEVNPEANEAIIEVNILGRSTEVTVPLLELEKVED